MYIYHLLFIYSPADGHLGCFHILVIFLKINLFILFIIWLCWVFVAACRLSLVAVSEGYSSCGARASHCGGFSRCRARASVVVARGL